MKNLIAAVHTFILWLCGFLLFVMPSVGALHLAVKRIIGMLCVGLVVACVGFAWVVETYSVMPRSLGPWVARRAQGHNPLIESFGRWLGRSLIQQDRGDGADIPVRLDLALPTWLGASAKPSVLVPSRNTLPPAKRLVMVGNEVALLNALKAAQAGDEIRLQAGFYRVPTMQLIVAGSPAMPIVVRAETLGDAQLLFEGTEGFHVQAPYWIFENLRIRGVCSRDSDCEHAFHVVGAAQYTVIRNNWIEDFNAQIKINGLPMANGPRFPDNGQIVGNTLINSRVRQTANPVTPIDLVAANGWRVEANIIADFIKGEGNRISYGAFAKGGGQENHFLRNLVLCEYRLRGFAGQRVGLSLGGGGTDPAVCRDGRCVSEQSDSQLSGNLIAQCADSGIDLNRASHSKLFHNTLIDTAGLSARGAETTADVVANAVTGPIVVRSGAWLRQEKNHKTGVWRSYLSTLPTWFMDAKNLDLRWRDVKDWRDAPQGTDLCQVIGKTPHIGAFADFSGCIAAALPSAK